MKISETRIMDERCVKRQASQGKEILARCEESEIW